MSYTQADLDAIDQAILDGNLTVRMGDRLVTRRSIEEMMAIRAHVAAQLQAAGNAARTYPRFQRAIFADSDG